MQIKRFVKAFLITALVLMILLIGVGFCFIYYGNIGNGQDLPELDRYEVSKLDGKRNILVLGTDKSGSLSDVLILFSVSPEDHTINSVSIPRDTRIRVNGSYQKINAAYSIGGESLSIQTIKELLGVPIHDYVVFSLQAVEDVIDALGGVDFDVPQNMHYEDPVQDLYIHLTAGYQHLNGDKALQLLRFRTYPEADIRRNEVQQAFLRAVYEQKANADSITKIPGIYTAINRNIKSSLSLSEVVGLAKDINRLQISGVTSHVLPGDPQYIGDTSYVINDAKATRQLMERYFK